MNRIFSICLEALLASVFLIPFFLYCNKIRFHSVKQTFAYTCFGLYLVAMYAVVGLPNITYVRFNPHFNFVPFLYMFSDWENSLLNVILFIPLGFFLPVLWNTFSPIWRTLLFGFFTTLTIEVMQIFTFRATDVNDLMTNTLGTLLGYGLAFCIKKANPTFALLGEKRDVLLVFGSAFTVMFFVQPFLSRLAWNMIYAAL